MTDTKVKNLVINKLTKAQFEASSKSDTELWFVTDEEAGGVSDVRVNGTSVVSSGVANVVCPEIDDSSTSSTSKTWSASKLNTLIGNLESLINAL